MDLVRVIAASLFVFAGVMATVAAIGASGGLEGRRWLGKVVGLVAGAVLIPTAMYLFNRKGAWLGGLPRGEWLADLERRDLIVETPFAATRAFGVHDYEWERPLYFLELADGAGILALCGAYLYEYEPIADDPELNQPRRFPCTTFKVRRHRSTGYALDVVCGGDVIEPEVMAQQRVTDGWAADGFAPEDGAILTGADFDELVRRLTASRG